MEPAGSSFVRESIAVAQALVLMSLSGKEAREKRGKKALSHKGNQSTRVQRTERREKTESPLTVTQQAKRIISVNATGNRK